MRRIKFTGLLASFLTAALILCALPFHFSAAADNALVISDCTSGWNYSGNSTISYSVEGTEGNGLCVTGSYGILRTLTYNTKSLNLNGYSYIEWDMKAIGAENDVLLDAFNSYRDSVNVRITDSIGGYSVYFRDDIKLVRLHDNWYHAQIKIDDNSAVDFSKIASFSLLTLENNVFDTSLPTTTYTIDTLIAAGSMRVNPEIAGVQYKGNSIRCLARVDKYGFEKLENAFDDVRCGFLVAPYKTFKNSVLSLDAVAGYEDYTAEKMYMQKGDEENIYFVCSVGLLKRDEKILVRAYITYTDKSGIERTLYSVDGLSGGYEVSLNELISEADSKGAIEKMKLPEIPDNSVYTPVAEDSSASDTVAGEPYAVPLKYNIENEVCIAIYDVVRDFSAPVNDLTADCSPAIQKALNAAKSKGGGVVYLPEGKYRCNSSLSIPGGVTLRGEWLPPEETTAEKSGSVLMVYTGNASVSASAFISLRTGSGIRNLNIFYPGMVKGDFSRYNSTIAETATNGGDSFTVMNVSVLGGTVGFDAATSWSELHTLKNVYFSCFGEAIKINNVTDIGRIEKVRINPEYFINNAYMPLTNPAKNTARLAAKDSDGIVIQRSDWEYVYDLKISGYNRGIVFNSFYDISDDNRKRGSNGQMFGVDISDCTTAFDVQYTNAIGYALTNINIKNCDTGLSFSDEYLSSFEIANLDISGTVKVPLVSRALQNGKITVTNSRFASTGATGYAVAVNGGGLSLQQCEFTSPNHHVSVGSDALSVSVLGCKFLRSSDINRPSNSAAKVLVDHKDLDLPVLAYEHTYKKVLPTPASKDVYDVTDFGASSGADSTAAFKAALAAASATGGTVYVPGGEYIINEPLTVPSGVELKGVYDVPTHSVTKGSVLCTDHGRNNESAEPFITLSEGSGVNGLEFYYFGQTFTNFIPYSYTVQSRGKNCWAKNCVFVNSYKGLDFGTYPSEGHYVQYISGSPLKIGMFVGNNSGNGWVENVQFNPHYWKRANISFIDLTNQDLLNDSVNLTLDSIVFGDNASEHVLGTFGYAANNLVKFISQGNGGTSGLFIGHGSDGCRNAVIADEIGKVCMVNSELVSMNGTGEMHHIYLKPTVTGTMCLFNTSAWANPRRSSLKVEGGKLIVCQMFYHNTESTDYIAEVNGGTLFMSSAMLPKKAQFFSLSGGSIRSKANLYKQLNLTYPPAEFETKSLFNEINGYYPTNCWWI